jgi:hypothetical protein
MLKNLQKLSIIRIDPSDRRFLSKWSGDFKLLPIKKIGLKINNLEFKLHIRIVNIILYNFLVVRFHLL